jgi:tetratricopeptide (TPR) repeat protein
MGRAARRARGASAASAPNAAAVGSKTTAAPATPRAVFAGLGLLVALAYGNALAQGLAVDAPFLLSNPRLASLSASNIWLILTRPYWWPAHADDLYRPITTASFFLSLGTTAVVPHLVNVLLHALNVWLTFRLAWRVSGRVAAAAVVAALFAVHPVGTDTVTNVAGRADLLACAAVLAGLLLHARANENPTSALRWRVGLVAAAVVGVFSKENAVVLLPLLLLYDFTFGRAGGSLVAKVRAMWRSSRASYLAVASVLVAMAIVRAAVMSDEMPHWPPFVDNPLTRAGFWSARLTALQVLGRGTGLLLWPARLSADYSYDQIPVIAAGAPRNAIGVAIATLALIVVSVAWAWRVRERRPAFFFWTLFFWGTRLPTANLLLLIGSIFAERFLYLPSIAFFGAVVALIPDRAARLQKPLAAIAALLLLTLTIRTLARNREWRDDESVWRAAMRDCPASYKPYKGLARVMRAQGHIDEAISLGERSLAILVRTRPALADLSSDLLLGLGEDDIAKGDEQRAAGASEDADRWYAKARAVLREAAAVDRATNNLVRERRLARGENEATIVDVGMMKIHDTYGVAALRLNDFQAARSAFEWSRRLDPTHEGPYLRLAETARVSGRAPDEIRLLVEAMIVAPDSGAVWAALRPAALRAGIHGLTVERGQPRVDPADAVLADVVRQACSELVRTLVDAHRASAAGDVQSICARNLGSPPR